MHLIFFPLRTFCIIHKIFNKDHIFVIQHASILKNFNNVYKTAAWSGRRTSQSQIFQKMLISQFVRLKKCQTRFPFNKEPQNLQHTSSLPLASKNIPVRKKNIYITVEKKCPRINHRSQSSFQLNLSANFQNLLSLFKINSSGWYC